MQKGAALRLAVPSNLSEAIFVQPHPHPHSLWRGKAENNNRLPSLAPYPAASRVSAVHIYCILKQLQGDAG